MAQAQIASSPYKHIIAQLSALPGFPDRSEHSADFDTDQNSVVKRRKVSLEKSPRKESLQSQEKPPRYMVFVIKKEVDENGNTVAGPDTSYLIKEVKREFPDVGDDDGHPNGQMGKDSRNNDKDSQDSRGSTDLPKGGATGELKAKRTGVECPECGFIAPNRGELQKHMRKHTPDKPYGCPLPGCDFRTRYPSNIRHHLPSHLPDRPFPCDQCELRFKRKSQLRTHMLIHTQVKKFACDQCEMRFKRRWEVKMHKLSHSDKKYFRCETCGHETKTLSDLNKHKNIHKDQRGFVCNICSKAYMTKLSLKKHMNNLHSDCMVMVGLNGKKLKTVFMV